MECCVCYETLSSRSNSSPQSNFNLECNHPLCTVCAGRLKTHLCPMCRQKSTKLAKLFPKFTHKSKNRSSYQLAFGFVSFCFSLMAGSAFFLVYHNFVTTRPIYQRPFSLFGLWGIFGVCLGTPLFLLSMFIFEKYQIEIPIHTLIFIVSFFGGLTLFSLVAIEPYLF